MMKMIMMIFQASEFAKLEEDHTIDEFLEIHGIELNELLMINDLESDG